MTRKSYRYLRAGRPGMMSGMQITEGVSRVDGIRAANVYLVVVDDGLLLVDCGLPRSASKTLRFIERSGRQPGEVRTIVITHCDPDHIGGAAELRRVTGARLAIHELDAGVLAGEEPPQKGGRAMAAIMRLLRVRPVAPDLRLRDGDEIGGLRVVHVPGHTAGSIALCRADGVVFSGDALLSDRHGVITPPDPRLALDRAQAAASADTVRALARRLLLPGHGAPAWVQPPS